jgi:transcriptional regulator GlxA family with amidase domain
LARRALSQGRRIKSIAARVGFGSAAALSRAYARKFGYAPSQERLVAEPGLAQHIIVPGRP